MAETLSPVPKLSFLDNNGNPAVGYKLFTYEAGTSTKLATYTDSGGMTPNSNPVVLDYRGEANVWIPPNVAYKYVFAAPNDTDPPAAPIWTVDNIVNAQFESLYGGVDTGSANAYVLTFDASFTTYTDGLTIYWLPANSNTGASTINVNGIGPVAITNANGAALVAGQIIANQFAQIIYKGTGFVLAGPVSDYPLVSSGAALNISTIGIGQSARIFKTANTVRASDATPSADPVLQFTNAPAGTYLTQGALSFSSPSAANFSLAWPRISGVSGLLTILGYSGGSSPVATTADALLMSDTAQTYDTTVNITYQGNVYGLETATAGQTLGPMWSQAVSDAGNTTLRSGSWLMVTRLS